MMNNRREFLKNASLLTIGSWLIGGTGSSLLAAPQKITGKKSFGLQIYSLGGELTKDLANNMQKLKKMGYDVLLDDRDERPGVKFKDMELIGLPYRITVGRKAAEGVVECTARSTSLKEEMSVEKLLERFRK